MLEILVSGGTGTGKSLYADAVATLAMRSQVSVAISDHELFTRHADFDAALMATRTQHLNETPDLSIIVVNNCGRKLSIEFGGRVPHRLSSIVFPNAAPDG